MTRDLYQHALAEVSDDVLALAGMAEHAVMRSVEVLCDKDMDGSLELIADDRAVDEKRYAIEANVMLIVSTQAPLASDMRALAAALFISNELERIGDYGKGIARSTCASASSRLSSRWSISRAWPKAPKRCFGTPCRLTRNGTPSWR